MATQRKKLIIDTDGGVDDAQAIYMMLDSNVYDVIGITCVRGNSGVDQVVRNVLKILTSADKLNIPVFRGCESSVLGEVSPNLAFSSYHGEDGFGDCPYIEEPDVGLLQPETAIDAMIRLTKTHPGEITLVCIGPLTNLAISMKIDQYFGSRLRDCYIMGGNYYGRGNATVCAEFNFYADPEAAFVALAKLRCPITLVGLEVCIENATTWANYDELRAIPGKRNQFLKSIEKKPAASSRTQGGNYCAPDAVLAAVILNPSDIVMETQCVYATVEVTGKITCGLMVVDWDQALKKEPNVNIVTKINKDAFLGMLRKTAENVRN